ncbi:MAG: MaoC-like dehydratase [Phenylobacterium sp.]|nr:MaoC-like dehydratase [Phenylobacterium sp.]
MPIYYPDILDQAIEPHTFTYTDREVMLYALGIGFGRDPLNTAELPFVYERELKVVPTAATVLGSYPGGVRPPAAVPPGKRLSTPNPVMRLHGEQKVELHRPLPTSGTFTATTRNVGAWDKGEGRAAVVYAETVWTDVAGGKVATLTGATYFRGEGGFGGPTQGAPQPHPIPDRAPDRTLALETRADQALLYRLNGDRNPLHSDPEIARQAGFEKPILHGLCTYGNTCRAVLQAWCNLDPTPILSHQVRFSAPVYPGETIVVEMWRDGPVISFEAKVAARGVTVIKNGKTVLRG